MARPDFDIKEMYLGTGDLAEYTFDFKIEALYHLLVVVYDSDGVEIQRVRGDDTTFLDSVDFDAVNGGGTVYLQDNLTADYELLILLANDEPTQPNEFTNMGDFTLKRFEASLDWLGGAIQRAAYLAQRSLKLPDWLENVIDFDMTLPVDITTPNRTIVTNDDGDAFELGPTTDEIANAQSYALAAQTAQTAAELAETNAETAETNAETAETNAEAAQAAAEAAQVAAEAAQAAAEAAVATSFTVQVNHNVLDGQAATNLTGETIDSAVYSSVEYFYEIIRGTTVFSMGTFSLHYRNSTWYLVMGQDRRDDLSAAHGVTFSLTGTTTAQLQAALNVGAGNGTIKLKKHRFTI